MSENINFNYNNITPFKWFIIENFPFVEDSIDALTNYQLLVKLGNEINKNRDAVNLIGENEEQVVNAFNSLNNYVNNYFDNLDVQDEINNKLDEMAESGTLAEIIEGYATIPELTQRVDNLERNAIYIGNSYTEGTGSTDGHTGLFALTKNMFKNAYKYVTSGGGFLRDLNHLTNFEDLLDDAIADISFSNDSITDIVIIGAWGESRTLGALGRSTFLENIADAMNSFVTKVNQNFSNVVNIKYIWAESRNEHNHTYQGFLNQWHNMFDVHNIMKDYAPLCGIEYCGWIGFNLLMRSNYFSSDNIHPSDLGYKKLASQLKQCYNGNLDYTSYYQYFNTQNQINSGSFVRGFIVLNPDHADIVINRVFLSANSTPAINTTFKLIDQSSLQYAVPNAYGYTLNLGYIQIATESTLDPSNDLIVQVGIDIENDEPYIKGTARNTKTPSAGIDNAPTTQSLFTVTFANR